MTSELKPCPFCGKTEQEVSDVHISTGWESADICCEGCGAQVVRHGDTPEKARENAIRAWNTRAERTCQISKDFAFACAISGAIYTTRFSCGHFMENSVIKNEINYCPTCGAKVVE